MQARTFSAEKINFIKRIKKYLVMHIVGLFFVVALLLISSKREEENYLLIFMICLIYFVYFIIIIPFFNSKKYIYEIRIEDTVLKIFGTHYNSEWTDSLSVEDVRIELIQRKYRNGTSRFLIVFQSNKEKHTINRLENWNNYALYELYTTFKNAKQENIIWDEKYVLDELERKAKDEFEWKGN